MSDKTLISRLEDTLRSVAADFEVDAPGFDPQRTPSVVLPSEAEAGRPRRVSLLAAAAVLAVVALAGAVVALRSGGGGGDADIDISVVEGGEERFPDGLRAPTWVPDGARLLSVGWEATEDSGPSPFGGRYQLFEDPEGTGRVVVHVMTTPLQEQTETTTVRGVPAEVSELGEGLDATKLVLWKEGGETIYVYLDGMTTEDGIAFLDGLERRSGDVHEGFVPPETGSLRMTDEGVESGDVPPSVTTTFVYGIGADPVADRLVMGTTALSRTTAPYMEAVADMTGSERPDELGTVTEDMSINTAMPDGTSVSLTVFGAPVEGDAATRMIESVEEIAPDDVQRLRDEMDDAGLDLPLEAAADLPSATVEVRGGGDFHLACLRRSPTTALRCAGIAAANARFTSEGLPESAQGGFVVDGRWIAVEAVLDGEPVEWRPSTPPLDDHAEPAVDGDWQISLLRVPDGVDEVHGSKSMTTLRRPEPG